MRLIDADALLAAYDSQHHGEPGKARKLIENAPTVDAVPVMHGRWIKRGYACGESEYKCSVCGETEWRTNCERMKYCMFCGAKMDGGDADDHG